MSATKPLQLQLGAVELGQADEEASESALGKRMAWALHSSGQAPPSPSEPLETDSAANTAWTQAAAPSRLSHTWAERGSPRGMAHAAMPRDSPTYHLVHGDVLAMVIQPDRYLRREAELPGRGAGRGGLWLPPPPPQPGRGPLRLQPYLK